MNTVEQFEKEKYSSIWGERDYTSSTAVSYAHELKNKIGGYVLEIGCGNGTSMKILNAEPHIKCSGVDITLAGCNGIENVFEAPSWSLPFENKSFDYSFSTDTFEHFPPEYIGAAITEIARVTRNKTFHYIACCRAVTEYNGSNVHMTVQSGSWWNQQFAIYSQVDYELKFWGENVKL